MPERCPTCGGPRDDEPREFYELCGCAVAPDVVYQDELFECACEDECDCGDEPNELGWAAECDVVTCWHPTREGAIAAWRKERMRRLEERKREGREEKLIITPELRREIFGEDNLPDGLEVRCEYADSVMVRAPGSMARITLPDDEPEPAEKPTYVRHYVEGAELVENPSLKADEQFVLSLPAAMALRIEAAVDRALPTEKRETFTERRVRLAFEDLRDNRQFDGFKVVSMSIPTVPKGYKPEVLLSLERDGAELYVSVWLDSMICYAEGDQRRIFDEIDSVIREVTP